MHDSRLSLIGKIDTALVKGIGLLLRGLRDTTIWLLGLLSVVGLPSLAIEYGEGLADLSWLEWGAMALLALLLWRHVHYCRHFAFGFWRGFSRLLVFQGVLNCLGLAFCGLLLYLFLDKESLPGLLNYLRMEDPLSKLTTYALALLAVYLASPTTPMRNWTPASVAPPRIEPTVYFTDKEAHQ